MTGRLAAAVLVLALAAGPAMAAAGKAGPKVAPKAAPVAKPAPKTTPVVMTAPPTGSWRQLTRDHDTMGLVEAGSVKRKGDAAQLMLAVTLRTPIKAQDGQAYVLVNTYEMDCKTAGARITHSWGFDELGAPRYDGGPTAAAMQTPPAGSNLATLIDVACGKRPLAATPAWPDLLSARNAWMAAGQ